MNPKLSKEHSAIVDRLGAELKTRLNNHFQNYQTCVAFKTLLSHKASIARKVGLSLTELSNELEERGYIKVIEMPSMARFLFSGDCPLTKDEAFACAQDLMMAEQAQRQNRKASGDF